MSVNERENLPFVVFTPSVNHNASNAHLVKVVKYTLIFLSIRKEH